MSSTQADLPFLEMILAEERRRATPLPLDALIALSLLRGARRAALSELARALQRDVDRARAVVERLVEAGLVQPLGTGRGRTYTLAPGVYRALGAGVESLRQAGFDTTQQTEMVRRYVREHGTIGRRDVMALCRLDENQAKRLLQSMCEARHLQPRGRGRATRYVECVEGPQA